MTTGRSAPNAARTLRYAPGLVVLGRRPGPTEEQELGSQQADALGAHQQRPLDLARSAEIGQQTDGVAVPGGAAPTA